MGRFRTFKIDKIDEINSASCDHDIDMLRYFASEISF